MTRLTYRECPECRGSGQVSEQGGPIRCWKCDGTGRVPMKVRREVQGSLTERLIVELRPEGVFVREKGRRIWYGPISYGKLLLDGARMYVEAKKREKTQARKLRRKR